MSDKRSVSTDALETLGTIIGDGSGRDAIHLAVEPVIAAERLEPGQDIGLLPDGRATTFVPTLLEIVDQFLKEDVEEGEKFWLVVYPRQITSLRHVWEHPAFDPAPISTEDRIMAERVAERLTGEHEQWIRDFVGQLGTSISYKEIIERASANDGSMSFGDDISGDIPDEFWDHAEIVLGKKLTHRATYFRCAC